MLHTSGKKTAAYCVTMCAALAAILSIGADAYAAKPTGEILRIEVDAGPHHAEYVISDGELDLVTTGYWQWNADVFDLGWLEDDNSGEEVAELLDADLIYKDTTNPSGLAQIYMGLVLRSHPDYDTQFTIRSGQQTFGAEWQPSMGASLGIGISDDASPADGATLTGTHTDGNAFWANYNGYVPAGDNFTSQCDYLHTDSGDYNEQFNVLPPAEMTGESISDMSMEFSFTLTPNDRVTVSANYAMIPVPEPATLLLVAAGLILHRRR